MPQSHLLMLPSELLFSVLIHLTSSPCDLHNLSQTCSTLHQHIFNDLLWRRVAGLDPETKLENVLYNGTHAHQRPTWLQVAKLNHAWSLPFPAAPGKFPNARPARWGIPTMKGKGKRSVELCISAGGGSISTRHVLASHGGLAPLTVQNLTVPRFTTGVLDPAAGRGALNYHADYGSLGHVDEDDNSGVMRVREAIEPWKQWKIDPALKVGSFSAFGDFLVALAAPAEDFPPEVVFRPHKLVCMRVLRDEENGISEVMWECDVQDEWLDTEDEYYQFPSISMFKLTSTHVVCLVSRHPSKDSSKLTRTELVVFKLAEGPIDRRTYRFQRNPLSKSPAVLRRRDLTSAFDHDLLVTDRYCVTGGPGGEILVWDYLNPDEHALPYEIPAWCSGVGPNDEFTRSYTGLTMSADGRYLGATMSDQLVIIDMVGKTVSGRYSNGRKIDPRRVHARHLQDPFPPGVWCCWKEWDVDGRECGDGVGYLNRAGYLYPPNRHGLQPQRPRWMYHGVSGLFLLVNMVVFLLYGWGDLVLVWGLATALIVAYLNW